MSLDLSKDARRLRWGVLGAGLSVLAVTVWVTVAGSDRPWQGFQDQFRLLAQLDPDRSLGIQQKSTCLDSVDRCTTCHLGLERKDMDRAEIAQPFRFHGQDMAHHLRMHSGCVSCHGGTGRALDVKVAHAMPGTRQADPLLRQPYLQASCGRCHVPGDQPGMEALVRGANLYLLLGCGICHPLTRDGRGGWDFGPDLQALGRKSLAYLEASLLEPAANFPQSTMPSFRHSFANRPQALSDMLIFLLSLGLQDSGDCLSRRPESQALFSAACASCHAGGAGHFQHRCGYLLERKTELACAACHKDSLPEPGLFAGRCPVVNEHRGNCAVCHRDRARRAGQ